MTFVDPDPLGPTYTVSGRGSSILVRAAPGTEPQLPALGAYATVAAQIGSRPPRKASRWSRRPIRLRLRSTADLRRRPGV